MNRTLEDARAFAAEEVTEKKADEVVEQFVYTMVRVSKRQPDGSVVVEASAIEPARKAICPVYPFCDQ
jgi:hypothetical protein